MLNIALIGAPNSGKSVTAHALKEVITVADLSCATCTTPVAVVDNYVAPIESRMDLVAGFAADYRINLAIALERWQAERDARKRAKTVITCGTLLDTAIYQALRFETDESFADDNEKELMAMRVDATFRILACLFTDTFHYSHVFYCPPLDVEDERIKDFDRNLQAGFAAFDMVPVTPLHAQADGDFVRPRVDTIMDTLNLGVSNEGTTEREDTTTPVAE